MSIRDHAHKCVQLFAALVNAWPDARPCMSELETQRARYKVWAGNLGVFASGPASADSRFENDLTAKGVLISLLTQLANRLSGSSSSGIGAAEETQRTQKEVRIPDDVVPGSSSSSESLVLEPESDCDSGEEEFSKVKIESDIVSGIEAIISRLYHFTSLIHSPVPSTERVRVRQYIERQSPSLSFGEFQDHIEWQLARQCPNLDAGSELHGRLLQAALYRRQKILYYQSHQAKLQSGIDAVFDTVQNQHQVEVGRNESQDEVFVVGNTRATGHERKANVAPTLFSETQATIPPIQSPSTYARSAVLSGVTASAVGRRDKLDIPPPPRPLFQGMAMQCPYCMDIIDGEATSQHVGKDQQWRRHVLKDLEPYICVFEGCSQVSCFRSVEDLVEHMRWSHTRSFSCQVAGHEGLFFEDAESLKQHFNAEHQDALPTSDLNEFAMQSFRPSPDVFTFLVGQLNHAKNTGIPLCPLCNFSLTDIGYEHHTNNKDLAIMRFPDELGKEIRDHLVSHMERLALLSLPEKVDVDLQSSDNQPASEGTTNDERLDTVSLTCPDSPTSPLDEETTFEPVAPTFGDWSDLLGPSVLRFNLAHNVDDDPLLLDMRNVKVSQRPEDEDSHAEFAPLNILVDLYKGFIGNAAEFKADVIFVHGIDGHYRSTWAKGDTVWPRDLLPLLSFYYAARIRHFSYTVPDFERQSNGSPHWCPLTAAQSLARQLATSLVNPSRPLIFVGHSFGGVVIKALLRVAESKKEYHSIINATKAIVLFSTPHAWPSQDLEDALSITHSASQPKHSGHTTECQVSWNDFKDTFQAHAPYMYISSFFETEPRRREEPEMQDLPRAECAISLHKQKQESLNARSIFLVWRLRRPLFENKLFGDLTLEEVFEDSGGILDVGITDDEHMNYLSMLMKFMTSAVVDQWLSDDGGLM
ncbi:hypothetical protein BDV19DRAFT_394697 [Aspergillus venezuelensis]